MTSDIEKQYRKRYGLWGIVCLALSISAFMPMPENPLSWIPIFGRAAPGLGFLLLVLSGIFFYLRKGAMYGEAIKLIKERGGEISLPDFVMSMNLRPAQAKNLLRRLEKDGIVVSGFLKNCVEVYVLSDKPVVAEIADGSRKD